MASSSQPSSPTYAALPSKLLLISTKSYFTPSRTLNYLLALLDSKNGVLPAIQSINQIPPRTLDPPKHTPKLLFALIPDHLSIIPCANILNSHTGHLSIGKIDPAPLSGGSWPIHLGSQDCFWASDYGAYTGEIVASALREVGVSIVEVGHAERRRLLGETDEIAAKKARAVAEAGMVPLVCVGETERPKEVYSGGPMSMAVGKAMDQLGPQITSCLDAVPDDAPVIFAYEPIWAIGADRPAGVEYVGSVVQAIRALMKSHKAERRGEVRVVYGGSAGPGLWSGSKNNGNGLRKWVDGMFLGRFAHEIAGVKEVVDEVVESLKRE